MTSYFGLDKKSIYLQNQLMFPLKGDYQDMAFRVWGNITLPSPSASCIFTGENTEGPLIPSLHPFWSPFTTHKGYNSSILAATTILQ